VNKMKGKRILGMMVVMAMLITTIPVLSENAKASSEDDTNTPSYLVIERVADGYIHHLDETLGNAYQDDKFGVEVVVHVKKYTADTDGTGTIELYPTALAAKGNNTGAYKIKWLELDATKFSFEGMNSEITPHATDYESSLNDIHNGFMMYNLTNDGTNYLIENWINVASEIAGAAAALAAGVATSEGGSISLICSQHVCPRCYLLSGK